MKQVNRTKEAIIWLILLVPFIYAFAIWNKVPEQVPTHFDLNGKPNAYSGKVFALLMLPIMNVAIYLLLFIVPRIDPRKKNYAIFGSSYQNIRLIIHLFLVGTFIFITQTTMNGQPLKLNVFLAGMLLFLALLGNYLRTVRSNFFVGIRTPWTLSNDVVWRKTHELSGRIWFYSGIVLAIAVFFLPQTAATIVMFTGVFIMVMVPVIYSYLEYRKLTTGTEVHNS
jgi:uncharacterized membrane protein